ncbi:hypothetical protein U9M48_006372 [Paspalum notatum var. saurae]|uniref:Uncharacterized protein n=1 Tax=Paspalum notatum var. saurae TaxID=547442 RepID=A0AAQ3SG50_PASNO
MSWRFPLFGSTFSCMHFVYLFPSQPFLSNMSCSTLSSSKQIQIFRTSLRNLGTLPRWLARLHVHPHLPLLVVVHIKELRIILSLHPVGNHLLLRLQG